MVFPRSGLLEYNNSSTRVDLGSFGQCGFDDISSREPGLGEIIEVTEKLFAGDFGGNLELGLTNISLACV